ncbi:MAG: hypothetical protein PVF54_00955 [Anaerolineae bacterium]|jgi:hypothetical protein
MRGRKVGSHVGVILGYALLTLVFTYPLVARIGDELVGRGNDLWIFQWNNWWVRKAWSEGLSPYHTPYMFHPVGVPLYFHSFSWFNSVLWMMLEPLAGNLAAHNLTVLLGFVISGYTTYLLVRALAHSQLGAFLAGIVFAFFRHRGVNHPNLFSVQWMPLVVLCLIRLGRTGRLLYAIGAGIALGLSALCGWQQVLLLGLWIVLWLAFNTLTKRWANPRRAILGLLVALAVCALLTAPLLWPIVAKGLYQREASLKAGALGHGGTDLLTYLLPNDDHPLIRSGLLSEAYDRFYRVQDGRNFAGFAALGLAIWAMSKRWKESACWALATFSFAILALGPELQVNGTAFPAVPMPYRLVEPTLVGRILRRPARLNIILGLSMAALTGIGAADLLGRLAYRRRWRYSFFGLLAVVIFAEYVVLPFRTSAPLQSEFFSQLRLEPGHFAVADFPIGYLAHDKWYMYAQTLHERPMVGGHVSRVPAHAHDFIERVPVLSEARGSAPEGEELNDISRQLAPLVEANVRYVIIHKDRASSRRVNTWRKWFAVQPRYEDRHLVVFRTAPSYGRDFEFVEEVGDGIGIIDAELSTGVLPQQGLLEIKVVWGTRKAPSVDWKAYLALTGPEGQEVQRAGFEPCQAWSTSTWGHDALARGGGRLQVDPFVRRGSYTVTLGLMNSATGREAGKPISVGQVEVQAIERTFETPDMAVESDVTFGTALKLLGYDLRKEADQVTLKLHWQALRRMETSYKFFVHLVNSETGNLVGQVDFVPYDWTYHTTWWEAEEVVSDEVVLPLADVPPMTCRVEIGVYHGDSGGRLPLIGGGESQQPADRYVLPEAIEIR